MTGASAAAYHLHMTCASPPGPVQRHFRRGRGNDGWPARVRYPSGRPGRGEAATATAAGRRAGDARRLGAHGGLSTVGMRGTGYGWRPHVPCEGQGSHLALRSPAQRPQERHGSITWQCHMAASLTHNPASRRRARRVLAPRHRVRVVASKSRLRSLEYRQHAAGQHTTRRLAVRSASPKPRRHTAFAHCFFPCSTGTSIRPACPAAAYWSA